MYVCVRVRAYVPELMSRSVSVYIYAYLQLFSSMVTYVVENYGKHSLFLIKRDAGVYPSAVPACTITSISVTILSFHEGYNDD